MRFLKKPILLGVAGVLAALLLPATLAVRSARAAGGPFNYFPTGTLSDGTEIDSTVNDGRFLALAGIGAQTLAGDTITVAFTAPAVATNFQIGIFDGDTGRTDSAGKAHWDFGTVPLEYSLYADPRGDATGRYLVGRWMGNGGDGTISGGMNTHAMPNNAWYDIPVAVGPEARNPNGSYYYVLKVRHTAPADSSISSFKVRSDAVISILAQAVSLYAPLATMHELALVSPTGQPTRYDGNWDINLTVPMNTSFIEVWDGDLDHGPASGVSPDTDDADTPNTGVPPWAVNTAAVAEGAKGTGSPPDDTTNTYAVRSPNIFYDVFKTDANGAPEGTVYTNSNPSGNLEWERFLVTNDTNVPADHYFTGTLPAGNYRVRVQGMDHGNLNAFRFFHDAVGIGPDGDPVVKIPAGPVAGVLGDYVWLDSDWEGDQDEVKAGIPGVKLEVRDANGNLLDYIYTNLDGQYYYPVATAGDYTVTVSPDNFLPGGKLEGLASTTGGNSLTRAVSTEDVLTYDFGYAPQVLKARLGDRVWQDANGNGQQDSGETGVPGVSVRLLNGSGSIVVATTTDADGLYLFEGLEAGNYSVEFVPAGGAQFTTANQGSDLSDSDADPGTGRTGVVTLAPGQADLSLDAGLVGGEPEVALEKTAATAQANPGEPVTYSYTVTNTGDVTLTDVTVVDDNATPDYGADDFVVGTVASLAAGASTTLTKTVVPPLVMCSSDGTIAGVLIAEKLASGDVRATFIQSLAVVDNTYGTGSSEGYRGKSGKGHTFMDLVRSDHAEFRFTNAAGEVVLDFYVDDISASSAFPSGYGTLGVSGGDGYMIKGSAAHVLSASTSASDNLNQSPAYHGYTTNSPVGDPNWEVRSIYSVVVSAAAFGSSGFGTVTSPDVHNSPAKIDTANLEPCAQDVTNTATVTARYGNEVVTAADTATVSVTGTTSSGGSTAGDTTGGNGKGKK